MNQDNLVKLAAQTLAICAAGSYLSPGGHRVNIATALTAARQGTVIHVPGQAARSLTTRFPSASVEVRNESTFAALQRLVAPGRHVACLNFASARTPGGGFQRGTMAQEEALSYASGLYPCLAKVPDFYTRNRALGSAIYLDLVIFSPRVPFFRDDHGTLLETPILASVISAPAPNARAVAEREPAAVKQIERALVRRADLVLATALAHKVDRLVLGAWGCGVFGNDPNLVARVFADLLDPAGRYANAFERVTFAVLDRSADKAILHTFERVLDHI